MPRRLAAEEAGGEHDHPCRSVRYRGGMGGLFLCFSCVFMITRVVLKRNGREVGRPSSVRNAMRKVILQDLTDIKAAVEARG